MILWWLWRSGALQTHTANRIIWICWHFIISPPCIAKLPFLIGLNTHTHTMKDRHRLTELASLFKSVTIYTSSDRALTVLALLCYVVMELGVRHSVVSMLLARQSQAMQISCVVSMLLACCGRIGAGRWTLTPSGGSTSKQRARGQINRVFVTRVNIHGNSGL